MSYKEFTKEDYDEMVKTLGKGPDKWDRWWRSLPMRTKVAIDAAMREWVNEHYNKNKE